MSNTCRFIILYFLFLGSFFSSYAQVDSVHLATILDFKSKIIQAKTDTAKLLTVSDYCFFLYQNGELLDFEFIKKQIIAAKRVRDKYPTFYQMPKIWNVLATNCTDLWKYEQNLETKKKWADLSISYFHKAISEGKRLKNYDMEIKSWFNLTKYYQQSNIPQFYKECVQLEQYILSKSTLNNTDSLVLSRLYKNITISLDYMIDKPIFSQSLDKARKFAYNNNRDSTHFVILNFEHKVRTFDKERRNEIVASYQTIKKSMIIQEHLLQLELQYANYHFQIKEYYAALSIINSIDLKKYPKKWEDAYFYHKGFMDFMKGACLYELGKYKDAIPLLEVAAKNLSINENLISTEYELYECYHYLSKAHRKVGNYQKAYDYLSEAERRYKELNDIENQILLVDSELKVQQIKQDRKLQEAETKSLLKEQEATVARRQSMVLFFLLAFTALGGGTSVYYYLRKEKLNRALVQQQDVISKQATSLSESNRMKDRIFALLSHDLRTPINRLIVALDNSFETQRQTLVQELYNVQGVLNNVLYWSSMQIKGLKPHYAEVHMKLMIDSLLKEFEHMFDEKNIITVNAVDASIKIRSDENYLKIILRNLLNNAIKFTENYGYIHLDCQLKNDDLAVITVKDTGIGISPEKLSTLFNYPTSTLGTKMEIGSGLGLSLSYEMVKQLKGDIYITSQVEKGTQVVIELPVVAAEQHPPLA